MTNKESKHLTAVFEVAADAVVLLENIALPSSVYSVIALAALAHPINFAFWYPLPVWFTLNPVTSFKPTSAEHFASGGDWITIVGGVAALYPVPKDDTLISVIWPLNIEAVAVAPVPPI